MSNRIEIRYSVSEISIRDRQLCFWEPRSEASVAKLDKFVAKVSLRSYQGGLTVNFFGENTVEDFAFFCLFFSPHLVELFMPFVNKIFEFEISS